MIRRFFLMFVANRLLIHRIILNLLSNAIKFTNKGKITVSFFLEDLGENQVNLKIDISDTGIGIPENRDDKIFESFTRLIPFFENKYPETGLGLYIVKLYLEQLGTKIKV